MTRRLYSLLIYAAIPFALAWLSWRGVRERAYWRSWGERFGLGPAVAGDALWVHAVSLGEVTAAAPLVRALRAKYPHMRLVLTTATPTGRARARALFAEADVRFLPYDTPGAVQRFLRRVRPRIAVIMETELWPNLFEACRRQGVSLVLANARLTAKSVERYLRLGALIRGVFASSVVVAAQTEADGARFVQIGAPPPRVHVAGNIKFDANVGPGVAERGREWRARFGPARPVWAAGSTHAGEEEQALTAHEALLADLPNALLLLAPRHPQRFDSVAELLRSRGMRFARRTSEPGTDGGAEELRGIQVLLVDCVGELAGFYAASDVVFVGGSLVPIGGHNLLEPAALGLPVVTGPSYANARDVARLLFEQGAAIEVSDAGELKGALARLLADPEERARVGARGRQMVESNRGAVERVLALIAPGASGAGSP